MQAALVRAGHETKEMLREKAADTKEFAESTKRTLDLLTLSLAQEELRLDVARDTRSEKARKRALAACTPSMTIVDYGRELSAEEQLRCARMEVAAIHSSTKIRQENGITFVPPKMCQIEDEEWEDISSLWLGGARPVAVVHAATGAFALIANVQAYDIVHHVWVPWQLRRRGLGSMLLALAQLHRRKLFAAFTISDGQLAFFISNGFRLVGAVSADALTVLRDETNVPSPSFVEDWFWQKRLKTRKSKVSRIFSDVLSAIPERE
ncbi:hypothetical protein EMVG_00168 [Emiliania huxleyi virus PS401]|nr:hypothetical protein EMVG_00168 [Emiliania huxleyi virus PS401]